MNNKKTEWTNATKSYADKFYEDAKRRAASQAKKRYTVWPLSEQSWAADI